MAKVKFVELEGNPTFTDRNIVANVEKQFLKTARKYPGVTWVVREQGFGKQGQNQWSQAREDVYVLGATKTKKDYWKRKALGNKKGGLPKYDPQKAVPRTTAAATFYHAAHRENQNLQRELSLSNLSDSERNTEYHKRKINVQVERVRSSDIKYFQKQGEGKKAFALAAKERDKRIKKITGAGVRITQSGEFEGKNEKHARLMFEGIQEGRAAAKLSYLERVARYGVAEDGQPKLVPNNIKVTDEFIDEVNARSFGTVKEERAFKTGALKFLQNKELHQQINTPDVNTFTPQRLEDTRSWHPGSTIVGSGGVGSGGSFDSAIPNYVIPDLNKVDTKFVGSTLITALPKGGPETSETVTLADPSADQDYGLFIDDEIFDDRSSFVNMLPDQTVPGQEFNYNIEEGPVPVQITSYAEELQASEEPTIRQTVVNRTKGEVTLTHNDPNSGKWSDKAHARVGEQLIETPTGIKSTYRVPNRIYYSQHVDTGLTAADLKLKATDPVQYAKVRAGAKPPDISTMITASLARVIDMGVPVTGSKGTDEVKSFLKGDAFTEEGDVADAGNVAPTNKKGAPGLLESFRESTDFITIEEADRRGFTGKNPGITSANPAQFEGQTSLSTSKPKYEVGTDMPGGEKGYTMTADELTRQQAIDRRNAAALGVGVKPIVTKKMDKGGTAFTKIYTEPKLPISEREAKGFWKKHVTTMTAEYEARKAIPGKNEAFIQGLRDKNKVTPKVATSTTPTKSLINDEPTIRGPEFYDDPDTWKDIGPAKAAPKPAVVPTPKPAVTSGKPLQLTEYDLSKTVRDGMGGRPSATPDNPKFPARPWYGGKSHAEMGLPVDKDGHLIKIKRPETAKPQADIELKKSAVLSKESGKPTFTTKGKKVKAAVKQGGKLLKGPGSTTLNALSAFTLLSPVIGAFGAVVQEQKRDEEAQAAYPLHPPKQKSLWSRFANMKGSNYSQALMHRLIPEEIYGKEGYSSLKKVKEFRRKGGRTMRDPI